MSTKYEITAEEFLELKRLKSFYPKSNGKKIFKRILREDVYTELDYQNNPDEISKWIEIYNNLDKIDRLYAVIEEEEQVEEDFLWLPRNYSERLNVPYHTDKFNAIKIRDDGTWFISLGDYSFHEQTKKLYTEREMKEFGFDIRKMKRSDFGNTWY